MKQATMADGWKVEKEWGMYVRWEGAPVAALR
jgi:hypothetical protein